MRQMSNDKAYELRKCAAQRIRDLMVLVPDDPVVFLKDRAIQERVTFHFVLAIQGCLSLAAEIVTDQKLELLPGLGGLFEALVEEGFVDEKHLSKLIEAAKLRNRILFDIEGLSPNMVYDAVCQLTDTLVSFLEELVVTPGQTGS